MHHDMKAYRDCGVYTLARWPHTGHPLDMGENFRSCCNVTLVIQLVASNFITLLTELSRLLRVHHLYLKFFYDSVQCPGSEQYSVQTTDHVLK
jgi:hypothetical protein